MKRIKVEYDKLIPTTEREFIAKRSWGKDWKRFKKPCKIAIGVWSGYNPNQSIIVHCDLVSNNTLDKYTIKYTDNTTLEVNIVSKDRYDILFAGINRIKGCETLIQKAIEEGSGYYEVK